MKTALFLSAIALTLTAACFAQSPKSLLINGKHWELKAVHPVDPSDPTEDGLTLCRQRVIKIDSTDTAYFQAETILHEAAHAFTCKGGEVHNERYNNTKGVEHPGIYFLAPRLHSFILDNPELIRFIQQAKR